MRRGTSCSASVPVTGGSVRAELLHQQLDLVTGTAALLAVDTRACTVRPCPWTRCRTGTKSGIPRGGHRPEASGTCHTSRHLGRTASRGVLSRRRVPPSRSRRTASRRGRSPAPLGQRAGGLRCSRLHSIAPYLLGSAATAPPVTPTAPASFTGETGARAAARHRREGSRQEQLPGGLSRRGRRR
jgi:hypothetical protein